MVKHIILFLAILPFNLLAQNAYFIDGYHGGIYGHYPDWQTQFMVDELRKNPDWKINLEIEPETWDSVRVYDEKAYLNFKNALTDPFFKDRIEFVNPAYSQGYLYNTSGESMIRQFEYGIKKMREHFPSVEFTTYSSEEPCFTSALPQILKSFGFKYASLKNPNTCWGGYTRAFGGELVNWVGPDGSVIKTVPRYACEELEEGSTWQTKAWANSEDYIQACFKYGIGNPVGMTLQDAAWDGGPWLGVAERTYSPSVYTTWTNYFERIAIKNAKEDWRFSQEDMLVSLMWGSQVLQRIAQQVRVSENKIATAEKLAALSSAYKPFAWPAGDFEEAWRNLLLAQHHDCWIVPYNGRKGDTWADKVARWTNTVNMICDSVIQASFANLFQASENEAFVIVANTAGVDRKEAVSAALPNGWYGARVYDKNNNEVAAQLTGDGQSKEIIFLAETPSLGYNTFRLEKGKPAKSKNIAFAKMEKDGLVRLESDRYTIVIDPEKGGVIRSLILKGENKEFVDDANERAFNELRGFFYQENRFHSSADSRAEVKIVENGPLRVKVVINGFIGKHPFSNTITLTQGDRKIRFDLTIDWQGNPGIGKYSQYEKYEATDPEKAFYNDQYKLLALFPVNLPSQKLYKNAPFDVAESRLKDTFFDRWDSIKHNVILNWVDATGASNGYGLALFSDHTASYAHGESFPLALNLQYSGRGLWGRDYKIAGPSRIRYALVPHAGKWDEAGISTESVLWNEPLLTALAARPEENMSRSLVKVENRGWEVSYMKYENGDLYIRIFNAEGTETTSSLVFDGTAADAALVELNGDLTEKLELEKTPDGKSSLSLSIPRFGLRTIKLENFKTSTKS